jgi:nitrate reductase NapAB chaperone NapD
MAITGIILHTLTEKTNAVQAMVEATDDLQFYGLHDVNYLVVVGEIPSSKLEARLEELEKTDGVLAVYTTYVNTEDEQILER